MNSEATEEPSLKDALVYVGMIPAMGGIIVGPIMIFYPLFLGLEWIWAGIFLVESAPTTTEWMLSPLVTVAGVLVTYAVFRLAIEVDRDVDAERQPEMSQGYLDALDEGELQGFLYLVNLLASRELAWKVLRERTPESQTSAPASKGETDE